jgi:hypothetical protein
VICPLYNFQVQNVLYGPQKLTREETINLLAERQKQLVEGIDIFEEIKVRRISKEEIEGLRSSFFSLPPDTAITANMFVLEKTVTAEDGHDYQADAAMRNIVLAMRLLKGGYVSGTSVFYIPVAEKDKNPLEVSPIEWSWEQGRKLESRGFRYSLSFDEVVDLKKLVGKIQSVDFAKRRSLNLACKRFQRAYEEVDFEDQLIDFIIAFEALFLKGEKAKSSQGETIAVACSVMLGKNDEERDQVKRYLREAYSIRNCIVHGSDYRKPKIDKEYEMSEFVPKIEDYLRESMKELLD